MVAQFVRALSAWLACGVVAAASALAADEVDAESRRAVRTVIEAQLQAFAAGDAARAYSYATPSIRARFGNAEAFLAMVRSNYPMVIGPAATSFLVPSWGAGTILQGVQLRDRDGHYWQAVYEMQRQSDMQWRINGCIVAEDDDTART